VFINNQLQTTVGQKAMVELRSRIEGLKVRIAAVNILGIESFAIKQPEWLICTVI